MKPLQLELDDEDLQVTLIQKTTSSVRFLYHGQHYTVSKAEAFPIPSSEQKLEGTSLSSPLSQSSASTNVLLAPMPGLVVDILVQEGQELNEGENLLVIEAMKMQNKIKAMRRCHIAKIRVQKGEQVETNAILIEFSN